MFFLYLFYVVLINERSLIIDLNRRQKSTLENYANRLDDMHCLSHAAS